MVFSDYTKCRILLLRESGKTYKRNFRTAAEERYSNESSRDFEVFNRGTSRGTIVRKKGSGCAAKNRLIKSTGKNTLCCTDRLIYITYRLFTVERTINLHRLIYRLNAPCCFPHIACSCNGKKRFSINKKRELFCDPYRKLTITALVICFSNNSPFWLNSKNYVVSSLLYLPPQLFCGLSCIVKAGHCTKMAAIDLKI